MEKRLLRDNADFIGWMGILKQKYANYYPININKNNQPKNYPCIVSYMVIAGNFESHLTHHFVYPEDFA